MPGHGRSSFADERSYFAAYATIRGLTVRNGRVTGANDGGGILIEAGNTVSLTNSEIGKNTANRGTGIANSGTLKINRLRINSNTAVTNLNIFGSGAGFYNAADSSALVANSTLTRNNG